MKLKDTIKNIARKEVESVPRTDAGGEDTVFAKCIGYAPATNMMTILDPFGGIGPILVPWQPSIDQSSGSVNPKQALSDYHMLGVRNLKGVDPKELYEVISRLLSNGRISSETATLLRLIVDQRKYRAGYREGGNSDNIHYYPQIQVEIVYTMNKWPHLARAVRIIDIDPVPADWSTASSLPLGNSHEFNTNPLGNESAGGVDETTFKSPMEDEQIKSYKKSINGKSKPPYYVGVSNDTDPCS